MSFEDNIPDIDPSNLLSEADQSIPEKCGDCGLQCDLAKQLKGLQLSKSHELANAAIVMGIPDESFNEIMEGEVSPDFLTNAKRALYGRVEEKIKRVDANIDSVRQEMGHYAAECAGVVIMKASTGEDVYTASVCTSPLNYDAAGDAHIPTHVSVLRSRP